MRDNMPPSSLPLESPLGVTSQLPKTEAPQKGWLLYDGSCGVCSRGVAFWRPVLERHGIGIAPLQSEWVHHQLGKSEEELLTDVRLLLVDGREIVGADTYRYILRQIWWALPLYILSQIPGVKQLFNWGYRQFADRRYRISRLCAIDAQL
jgi:predicted DCC family thiol-disulfide oxidoreductase YuxK